MMKTVKLDSLRGLSRKIAETMIKVHGEYRCTIDGVKTVVIK